MTDQNSSIKVEALARQLEPIIRRIIREELSKIIDNRPDTFFISPEMPIYDDMEDIIKRDEKKKLKFFPHDEVWGA